MSYQDVSTIENIQRLSRKFQTNFGKAIGFQTLSLTDNAVHTLTVPTGATYAQMRLKTTSAATNTPVAWYRMDGTDASAGNGIPLLGWEMLDVTDNENLVKFSIRAVAGTETLYIQYFNQQF